MLETLGILLIAILSILSVIRIMLFSKTKHQTDESELFETTISKSQLKPQFKPLTPEQVEEIHSRGKITPAEKVEEWEKMDLCAPGDNIESAAWRCKKFNNSCHDCLIDYANEHDEYTPFSQIVKESHFKIPIKPFFENPNK